MNQELEDKIRKFLTKKFCGYARRWEVGSEEKESVFNVFESEIKELIELIKKEL